MFCRNCAVKTYTESDEDNMIDMIVNSEILLRICQHHAKRNVVKMRVNEAEIN